MKKFLIATIAATSMVSAAHAGSISLDLRADSQSQTFNDDAGSDSGHRYYFKVARINYEASVNESLSFRLRGAYNKSGDVPAATVSENNQAALEFAYIQHKMGDFTLQVGRISPDAGGLEGATSGADLYLTSQAYTKQGVGTAGADVTNGLGSPNWLSTAQLLYVNGAKLSYSFMPDQSVSVVTFKAPAAAATASNADVTGLIWKGAFLDKSLKTQVSYHMGNGETSTADKRELIAAGISWTFSPIVAQLDYLSSSFKQDASGDKDMVTSYVAKVAYTGFEKFTPRLEYVMSENKAEIGGDNTDKFQGYGAVVEFRPYSDFNNFRYHVAYHSIKQELRGNAGDAEVQELTVGARILADFLK